MIKQNGYLENLLVFVCVSEGRVVVMVVCVGGFVGVLMRFVWRSLGVGMGVCFGLWVGRWVRFWTHAIDYMPILTIGINTVCLTQFGQKVVWVSFGKTLFKYKVLLGKGALLLATPTKEPATWIPANVSCKHSVCSLRSQLLQAPPPWISS